MFEDCQCCRPNSPVLCTKIHVLRPLRPLPRQKKRIQLYTHPSKTSIIEQPQQPIKREQQMPTEKTFKLLIRPHSEFNIDYLKRQLRDDYPTKFGRQVESREKGVTCPDLPTEEPTDKLQTITVSIQPPMKGSHNNSHTKNLATEISLGKLTHYQSTQRKEMEPTKQSQTVSCSTKLSEHGFRNLLTQNAVLTESRYQHHEQPRMVIEQSMVQMRSVRDNFVVLKTLQNSANCKQMSAVEKNIGLLVSLKIYECGDLQKVSQEQRGHQAFPTHPNMLRLYRGAVEPNQSYIMMRQYYADTLKSLIQTQSNTLTNQSIQEYCQQLLGAMNDLAERRILLPNVRLEDIAVVCGMCKFTNFQDWQLIDESQADELGWYYVRKMSQLLRAIFQAACQNGIFTSHSQCVECLGFLRSVQNEHLSLRLLLRHPYLSSSTAL